MGTIKKRKKDELMQKGKGGLVVKLKKSSTTQIITKIRSKKVANRFTFGPSEDVLSSFCH